MTDEVLRGRLVLDDEVVPGRLVLEDGWIRAVEPDPADAEAAAGPIYAPGFVDVHVHGWGGHDALGDADALSGMARALLRRGVTSFLPTAPTIPVDDLPAFAERVRTWMPDAPDDGAQPLGFNLEGPFLAPERRGAHDLELLRTPAAMDDAFLEPLLDGLRVMTVAPELPGALELIARLAVARRGGVARPFAVDHRAGPGRLRGGGALDDPPVQRDDRRRPPGAGARRGGAAR